MTYGRLYMYLSLFMFLFGCALGAMNIFSTNPALQGMWYPSVIFMLFGGGAFFAYRKYSK
jgi:hypothetical protein